MGLAGFRRTVTGRVVLRLDEVEHQILVDLVGQVAELVAPEDPLREDADPLARLVGIDPDAERPDDPALARLFPDAYPDDDEASLEFRRFTERSLRDLKLAHARTVLDSLARSGDKITLTDAEVPAWLGTLNDLRLTLGSRLGLDDEDDPRVRPWPADEDDPVAVLFHVYDWLTYLQDTLVTAVSGLQSVPPPGVED